MLAFRETVNRARLVDFLGRYGNSISRFEALLFLSRHPVARFPFDVLAGSRGARRVDLADAVKSLVGDGIIREEIGGDRIIRYSLTSNQNKRKYVEGLTALDDGSLRKYWRDCGWGS